MIKTLDDLKVQKFYCTQPKTPRALEAVKIAGLLPLNAKFEVCEDVQTAVKKAQAIANGEIILVTGSLYTVAEALPLFNN